MSEYQYYEFQAIDRRLTESEMAFIRTLSSRVVLSSTSAAFVYHYGDFRGNEEDVLEKYFDAMLYIANWGSRRLMFRFPRSAVDANSLLPYCVPDVISVKTTATYVVLDMFIRKEQSEWTVDGEYWLSRLIPLREAILRGDHRVLYLAWLRAVTLELGYSVRRDTNPAMADYDRDGYPDTDLQLDDHEPPIPPNLRTLTGPLQALTEFFEVSDSVLAAGAAASPSVAAAPEPIEQWIARLSELEAKHLLARVARGEPGMDIQILALLRQRFADKSAPLPAARVRTIRDVIAAVDAAEMRIKAEQNRQAQAARTKRLGALAAKEPALWDQVDSLIRQKKANAYDEAIRLLLDLRDLADYRGQLDQFRARIRRLADSYSTLPSLQSRLVKAKLIE